MDRTPMIALFNRFLTVSEHGLPRALRTLTLISFATLVSLTLSGCLFDRVITVKNDLCDFEENFAVELDQDLSFTFNHPVLNTSDIIWLMGAEPSNIDHEGQNVVLNYVIQKTPSPSEPDVEFVVSLSFVNREGDFLLEKISSDEKLAALVNPEMLERVMVETAASQVCEAGISFASTRMEYDIPEERIASLPSRQEILKLLGDPSQGQAGDAQVSYEFRVGKHDANSPVALLTLWFNPDGGPPTELRTAYSRYQSHADFNQGKLRLRLRL